MYICTLNSNGVKTEKVALLNVGVSHLTDIISKFDKMYAIVDILGHQFKVEQGMKLFVHRMNEAEVGSTVEFDRVLLVDNEGTVTVGTPVVEGAKVVCEVVSHLKGDKVIVFHKKRRKGYRKRKGHRQSFTELKVKEIVA